MKILLSKVIPLFIYPVGLLFILLLAAFVLLWWRKRRATQALLAAAILLTLVAGNKWVSYSLIRSLESAYPPLPMEAIPESDVVVVLGGGLGVPHPPRLYPDLLATADRLLHGFRLYRAGKARRVLLTGGNVFPQPGLEDESFYARRLLELWGVPNSAVVVEANSRNTLQNAENTARMLEARQWRRVLLVTSAAHMYRAVTAFRHAGVTVTPVPVDFLAVDADEPAALTWIPSVDAIGGTTYALHEYLGRLWYRLRL